MNRARKILRSALISVSSCLAVGAIAAPSAVAALEFDEASAWVKDTAGAPSRQAGAHSDFTFHFSVADEVSTRDGITYRHPTEMMRDIDVELPPGLIGNPTQYPTCTIAEILAHPETGNPNTLCPVESQVGTINLGWLGAHGLFNLEHGPGVPALFGFNHLGYISTIVPRLKPGPYGDPERYAVVAGSTEIAQGLPAEDVTVTLWANPASPAHDFERQGPNEPFSVGTFLPSSAPQAPFFTTPTVCDKTQTLAVRGDSWEHPGIFDEESLTTDVEGTPFSWEGCEKLPFAPEAEVSLGNIAAHSPTGLGVHLELPQDESVGGLATSAAKRVALTLPEGMAISPSTAAGQSGCTQLQVSLATNDAPTCPSSSKIGTVEVETPLLTERLKGSIVLATQNDNPFNSTYALYMLVKGPNFWLKQPGQLLVDKQTGQLRTVFDELPQLSFEAVDVELENGPLAPLSTPQTCGTYTARSEITPWARPTQPVVQDIPMQVDENCNGGGFSPGLKGGTTNPVAGKRSPFVVRISRQDGEQNISRIDVTLPEGQLASLKGVGQCPEALAPSGACPANSQIGVAGAAIGVGSSPLQVPQPGKAPTALFLGGPYKGAPLSLVALVPAQAGPFDLGNVVVRTALNVDPTTAQVTAKSDPLPQILEGVPLAYREIRIELTRPDFGVNPSSCERMAITSTLTSVSSTEAHPSVPYQVGDCASLGFSPQLKLAFKGKMNRTGNPAVNAVLKAPPGQANIAKTTVILPKSQFIDNAHISNPCTRVQFNAGACPAGSILGTATAYTPLLDQPLSGPVYFRSNGGERELPDLVADLNGQIHVTLVGFIDSKNGGVRTRFQSVPDAPVSKFVLKLKGGKKGLIENSRDLCSFTPRAKVQMTGQNGKPNNFAARIATSCGKGKKK